MFIHETEMKELKKSQRKYEKRLFFGYGMGILDLEKRRQRDLLNRDNRKWAYVTVAGTRKMVWVDNVTMKAYKSDGYNPTWIEIKKFVFDRWCTTMDL